MIIEATELLRTAIATLTVGYLCGIIYTTYSARGVRWLAGFSMIIMVLFLLVSLINERILMHQFGIVDAGYVGALLFVLYITGRKRPRPAISPREAAPYNNETPPYPM